MRESEREGDESSTAACAHLTRGISAKQNKKDFHYIITLSAMRCVLDVNQTKLCLIVKMLKCRTGLEVWDRSQ